MRREALTRWPADNDVDIEIIWLETFVRGVGVELRYIELLDLICKATIDQIALIGCAAVQVEIDGDRNMESGHSGPEGKTTRPAEQIDRSRSIMVHESKSQR